MKYSKYNAIIIGSGISGLFLANKLAKSNKFKDGILLVTKDELFSGSSALAQGGIVSVIPEINKSDSIESHIKDTIESGCGLNNINTVRFVSERSAKAIDELMRLGVKFDSDSNGLNFTLEGAHSVPRILHSDGDSTGRVIERTLVNNVLNSDTIEIYEHTMAIELLKDSQNVCRGIVAFNWQNRNCEAIFSNNIIIATGGVGQIYKRTTNPIVSCGDGIALAIEAAAEIENMEFVQFHPTALYCENKSTVPLISESVRGEGAKLVDLEGNYFAKDYHKLADLAPRDVVSRAIKSQIEKSGHNYVNLDISQIGIEKFKRRFPTITKLCCDNNIDLSTGFIPVAPAEHYFMGGIKVDLNSSTNIKNLYAIGECSSTGLHGANRLASNSLLECVVFASNLSDYLINNFVYPPKRHDEKIKSILDKYQDKDFSINSDEQLADLFSYLKDTMSNYVGISRDLKGLGIAFSEISDIEKKFNLINVESREKFELKSAIIVSKEIIKAAILRQGSIGAHFRLDSNDDMSTEKIQKGKNNDKILA